MSYQTDEYADEDYLSWDEWADDMGYEGYWLWAREQERLRNPFYRAWLLARRWYSRARNWFKRQTDDEWIPF